LARLTQQIEPDTTRWKLTFGTLFETNADGINGRSPATAVGRHTNGPTDAAVVASARVTDDRNIAGQRWQSRGTVYGEAHAKDSSLDFHQVTGETGPSLILPNGWTWRPMLSAETGFLGYDYLYTSLGLVSEIDFRSLGPLRRTRLQVNRTDFSSGNSDRDAWVFAGRVEFTWDDVLMKGAALSAEPYASWYRAESYSKENRYWQFGVNIAYAAPVAEHYAGFGRIYVAPEFTIEAFRYSGRENLPPGADIGKRNDLRFSPGIKLIGTQAFKTPLTAILGYDFDYTKSNYDAYRYTNHRVMLTFVYEL
jgi:hypothetical protein